VVLGDKRERGIGLRPAHGEWKLELGRADGEIAQIVDTAHPAMKWQVAIADGALRLDAQRFVADHAYRVELRHGDKLVGAALVYLYPPKVANRSEVVFDGDDAGGSDELTTVPKPTL
jgi:hypothetical protein